MPFQMSVYIRRSNSHPGNTRTLTREQKFNPTQPLSTPLFSVEDSVEFTSRMARLLAKKTQLPVYVGSSISLASAGLGGTVEEEMEAFRKVVDVVTEKLHDKLGVTNGVSGLSINSSS